MIGQIQAILAPHGAKLLAQDDAGRNLRYDSALDMGRALLSGLSPGRMLIFLLMRNTTLTLAAYLAILDRDCPVVLLDAGISPILLKRLITQYRPEAIVTPDAATPVEVIGGMNGKSLHPDLSVMLSTSGSTGSPKLARFSFSAVMSNAASISEYLEIDDNEVPIAHLPLNYSFGYSIINSHFISGACIQLTSYSLMQREFWNRTRDTGVTSFSGVPYHYEMLRRLGFARIDAPSLRIMTQAGGRLSEELVRYFATETANRQIKFVVMYGQTEAGPRISYLPATDTFAHAGTIGKAIPGVALDLRHSDGRAVMVDDVEGELICRSPGLMMGYATSRADLAEGDTLGGVLATGDLALRNEAGYFVITGRTSRFIKVMGTRVSLDDAEEAAGQLGFRAAAIGEENKLVLVIEGEHDVETVRNALIEALKIPPSTMHIRLQPQLPRAPSGKILYAQLADLLDKGSST